MPRKTRQQVERVKMEREEAVDLAATPFSGESEDAVPVPPKRKRGRPRKSTGVAPPLTTAGGSDIAAASSSTQVLPLDTEPVLAPGTSSYNPVPPTTYPGTTVDYPTDPIASSSSQPILPALEPPTKPGLEEMAKVEKPSAKKARKSTTVAEGSSGGPSEFRPARVRQKAPQATMQRMERVMSQRMFMMDRARIREGETPAERFAVLGSTGNVYTVIIDYNPTCDCPDCLKGNVPCKHIVFVFLKVLKMPVSSTIWYQKGLTPSELKHVFEQAPPNPNDPHMVPATVKKAYLKATGRGDEVEEVEQVVEETVVQVKPKREVVGEDCPVCYEEMTEEDVKRSKLVFDESAGGCGNALHTECFQMWAATARAKGDEITCVYCRTPWAGANGATGGEGKAVAGAGGSQYSSLGYLNLADIAGVSRERDTSSYYHGPMAGARMWQNRYADD